MATKITNVVVRDIRFPTSRNLDGSDAMNAISDYSATYVTLQTDSDLEGSGLTFTIGRGNDLCVVAARELAEMFVIGQTLEDITADFGAFWHKLVAGDCQLRWVGPEKGLVHLATAALVNALWDMWAKSQGKPVWKMLVDMSPEELVRCVDFTYISDILTPYEAIGLLRKAQPGKAAREAEMLENGFPGYTTAAGWLGYSEEKMRRLAREAVADGWTHLKQKIGADIEQDVRRAQILREELGWDRHLMMDANQNWDVDEAVQNMRRLPSSTRSGLKSPPARTMFRATAPSRIVSARSASQPVNMPITVSCSSSSSRLVPWISASLIRPVLAASMKCWPCCSWLRNSVSPSARMVAGVGLCQYSLNIVLFDYIAVTGNLENRVLEYVDHLHENFKEPLTVKKGRYYPNPLPGYGATMKADSLDRFEFPNGAEWAEEAQ